LNGERYLNRINCEQANVARDVFAQHGTKVERVYRSDRDDWILAMVAAGLGFAFMPQYSITEGPDIVVRPLVEPAFGRGVPLVTGGGRPHSPATAAAARAALLPRQRSRTQPLRAHGFAHERAVPRRQPLSARSRPRPTLQPCSPTGRRWNNRGVSFRQVAAGQPLIAGHYNVPALSIP